VPCATPENRALAARIAAHTRWAAEPDRTAATAPARRAAWDRFERQVDPDGILPAAERAKRAESARKAYYLGLALKSAKARRSRATRGPAGANNTANGVPA
jgi:hypothetical protein